MGNCVQRAFNRLRRNHYSEKSIVLLIVGLDNAGKTSILNRISGAQDINVLPTMGFRTLSLKYKSYSVKIYDLGGSSQIRSLWPKYYNDIHGLIYVVDASDISRLMENKVVFAELISHECISGKPLLLLANKQDLNGAIDELDLVENLNVEHAANSMRCPTRVETCSCLLEKNQSKSNMMGIMNGYRWLLDTILKNYSILNNTIKSAHSSKNKSIQNKVSNVTNSPSILSVHSNPFKPIKELISQKEEVNTIRNSHNGIHVGKKLTKVFMCRNKTAPFLPNSCVNHIDIKSNAGNEENEQVKENDQTECVILNPLRFNVNHSENRLKLTRPFTAPECTRFNDKVTTINIPGQVP